MYVNITIQKEKLMDTTDELTGLYDRTAFLDKLDQALTASSPDGPNLLLIMMDIDHLLPFNEGYGHVAGDAVIQAYGHLFAETFKQNGLVGRYGGDEFIAAVWSDVPNAILEAGEELCQAIAQNPPVLLVDGKPITSPCSLSLGMAIFPADAGNVNDLIDRAKQALYRAKEAGGKTVYLYEQKDGLTGLLNRNAALHLLEDSCAQAAKLRQPVSIIIFDIDDFAHLNQAYGHRFGDELLKRIGDILKANFEGQYPLGRIRGDEFMVILPDCRAETAFVLAEEVRKLVADGDLTITIGRSSQTIHSSVSGGVATFSADANDPIDLVRKADEAMYRAKQTGRNRICLPSSTQMTTKTSYYTQVQLERLATLAKAQNKSEAFLLREALDDLFRKYEAGGK